VVKIKDPAQAPRVAPELNDMSDGQYRPVQGRPVRSSQKSMLKDGGISVMIDFLSLSEFHRHRHYLANPAGRDSRHIKEFASCGHWVSRWGACAHRHGMSLWVGAAGLLLTALLTAGSGVGQEFWRAHGLPAVY